MTSFQDKLDELPEMSRLSPAGYAGALHARLALAREFLWQHNLECDVHRGLACTCGLDRFKLVLDKEGL